MDTQDPPVEEAERIFELAESGSMLGMKTPNSCSVERNEAKQGSARRDFISPEACGLPSSRD